MTPIPSSFRNPPQSQLTYNLEQHTRCWGKWCCVYKVWEEGRWPTSVHINCQK